MMTTAAPAPIVGPLAVSGIIFTRTEGGSLFLVGGKPRLERGTMSALGQEPPHYYT